MPSPSLSPMEQALVKVLISAMVVIEALLDDIIDETIISDAMDAALSLMSGDSAANVAAVETLAREITSVERERQRLLAAVGRGEAVSGLLDGLRLLERRQAALEAERDAIAAQRGVSAREADRVRAELLELAASWRTVLADDPTHARPIVSSLLKGRVSFEPLDRGRWRVRGEGHLIGLFSREVTGRYGVPKGNSTLLRLSQGLSFDVS